jgi:hypothetical protein
MSEADRTTLFGNEAFAIGMLQAVSGGATIAAIAQAASLGELLGRVPFLVFVTFMVLALGAAVLAGYWRHEYKMWDVKTRVAQDENEAKNRNTRAKCYLTMMRRAMRVAVTSVLLAFASLLIAAWKGTDSIGDYSISFVDVAPERTKLISGIDSYQSIEEAKNKFPVWQVIEQSSLSPKDKRPPFNIYKVSIKNYSHLGISGELQVEFFNNRLMETRFLPDQFEKYVELLVQKEHLKFVVNRIGLQETTISPHTRVWIYANQVEPNYKYVGWVDIRLERELYLWIKRYA